MSGSFFGKRTWSKFYRAKRMVTMHGNFRKEVSRYRETPEQALYRELREEVGLLPEHVQVIAQTKGWR